MPAVRQKLLERPVVLNVGGVKYMALPSTFENFPDSLLGNMFASRNAVIVIDDASGEFFFDRNGRTFEVILDYYRTGRLTVPPTISMDSVREELDYFGILPMANIQPHISPSVLLTSNSTTTHISSDATIYASYLVERTLQIMSDAKINNLITFTLSVDKDGNVKNLPTPLNNTTSQQSFWVKFGGLVSQSLVNPTGLLEFEGNLRQRFAAGGVDPERVIHVEGKRTMLVAGVDFLSSWEVTFTIPTIPKKQEVKVVEVEQGDGTKPVLEVV